MNYPETMGWITGLLQFAVAGYALRLNRIFGTAKVGWSLFCAFTLLALLHLFQSLESSDGGTSAGMEIEVIYLLISLLLLTSMIHIETVLKERRRVEEEGERIRAGLELMVADKTAHLTKAIEDLKLEILERKKAETRIGEQARMLELAYDAIFVRDMEDRILYWNKGAERIYGWTTQEALGRKLLDLLPKDMFNALKFEEAGKVILENGNWQGEFTTRTKGGKEVIVEARWTLVRDEQGNPRFILNITNDITEKKRFEAQFLRAQRMENIGALAGGIAHDLNNILTPLLVSVQVLKGKVADDDGKKLLEALEANVQRGASLVKQVLTFGRGPEDESVVIQPRHIVHELKQIIHETFPRSVEFELRCPADLWTFTGNAGQLQQGLMNLCLNARDAMPNGGKLSVQIENQTVDETFASMNPEARPGPYVVMTVADNGTGIPREIREKMFDPFFTTKEPGKSAGLGLSSTLAIINNHNGFILCESELGKGTAFKIFVPANPPPATTEKPATDSRLPRGHNKLVLVVDDEEPILDLVQKVLKRYGYRVLLAQNGVEAVALYARHQKEINVVITDMVMPIMDGPATIAALKAIDSKVRIVGSSGLVSRDGQTKAKNAGVKYFIPKPYTAEAMLNTLHDALSER
jgi:two-component system, cell cycle sensor histidine kinase and response regulator CckA